MGQPTKPHLLVYRNLRKKAYAECTVPYLNRNGSPGCEPTVYGITCVREFGKIDLYLWEKDWLKELLIWGI